MFTLYQSPFQHKNKKYNRSNSIDIENIYFAEMYKKNKDDNIHRSKALKMTERQTNINTCKVSELNTQNTNYF